MYSCVVLGALRVPNKDVSTYVLWYKSTIVQFIGTYHLIQKQETVYITSRQSACLGPMHLLSFIIAFDKKITTELDFI